MANPNHSNQGYKREIICTSIFGFHEKSSDCLKPSTKKTVVRGENAIENYDLEALLEVLEKGHVDIELMNLVKEILLKKCMKQGFYEGLKYIYSKEEPNNAYMCMLSAEHEECVEKYGGSYNLETDYCGPDTRKSHKKCMELMKGYYIDDIKERMRNFYPFLQ